MIQVLSQVQVGSPTMMVTLCRKLEQSTLSGACVCVACHQPIGADQPRAVYVSPPEWFIPNPEWEACLECAVQIDRALIEAGMKSNLCLK